MFVGQLLPHVIAIHICTKGLPLDYHGVAEGLSTDRLGNAERLADRRGIAFGLPLGLPWDWRKMGIAKGLPTVCQWNTLGLCRDSLGIGRILPGCDLGIDKGLPYLWTRLLPAPP